MASFLSNIAPGVASISEGYLKGVANTQEKYRQEELDRGKDALRTYMKLIESGHWEPVDPEKGAKTPGVLAIGGMFLQPKEIPAWKKAEFEAEESKREHDRWKMGQEREVIGEKRNDLISAREHELKKRKLDLEQEYARLEAIRERAKRVGGGTRTADKVVITRRSDKSMVQTLDPMDYDEIMKSDPSELNERERMIQKGVLMGELEVGKPSTATTKTMVSPVEKAKVERENAKELSQILVDINDAENPPDEDSLVNYASRANYLTRDNETYFYGVTPGQKIDWARDVPPKWSKVPLPVMKDVNGKMRQVTIGEVRQLATAQNMPLEQVIAMLFQSLKQKGLGVAK